MVDCIMVTCLMELKLLSKASYLLLRMTVRAPIKKLYPSLFSRTQFHLFCNACDYVNHTRNSYPLSDNKTIKVILLLLFILMYGVLLKQCLPSRLWFVAFIDCRTRMTWVNLLNTKNEVFSCLQSFYKMIST